MRINHDDVLSVAESIEYFGMPLKKNMVVYRCDVDSFPKFYQIKEILIFKVTIILKNSFEIINVTFFIIIEGKSNASYKSNEYDIV